MLVSLYACRRQALRSSDVVHHVRKSPKWGHTLAWTCETSLQAGCNSEKFLNRKHVQRVFLHQSVVCLLSAHTVLMSYPTHTVCSTGWIRALLFLPDCHSSCVAFTPFTGLSLLCGYADQHARDGNTLKALKASVTDQRSCCEQPVQPVHDHEVMTVHWFLSVLARPSERFIRRGPSSHFGPAVSIDLPHKPYM